MDKEVYRRMIQQQREHWWFNARREILDELLDKFSLPENQEILEIGCGTGGNLSMLKRYGNVSAMEMDEFAVESAKCISGVNVKRGWLLDNIPYKGPFDLICMFDVLEHIQNEEKALLEIKKLLSQRGTIFITVPAYSWLYGIHDKMHHHYRRYSKGTLEKKISDAGFTICKISYFNMFLFPLALIARLVDMLKKSKESIGFSTPNCIINKLFYLIFRSERLLLNKMSLPFGTSIVAVCSNNGR